MSAIRFRLTLRRTLIATVAVLLAVFGVIPAAQAHDYLVGSTPKLGSTVSTAPQHVTLKFNDIVLTSPAPPQVSVKGPAGRYYETGCGKVTDATVATPVALGGAGKYTVTWRIVSADGHPVSDSLSFTYHPKPGAKAAEGIAAPKPCTDRTSAPASAAPQKSDGGAPTGAIVAVVIIAVLGVGGVAAILLTRGRARQTDTSDDEVDEGDDDEE